MVSQTQAKSNREIIQENTKELQMKKCKKVTEKYQYFLAKSQLGNYGNKQDISVYNNFKLWQHGGENRYFFK